MLPARLGDARRAPSARPRRGASAGWTSAVQRSGPLASSGRLCIQLLLRAQVAAADDDQGGRRREVRGRPLQVVEQRGRRQLDLAEGVRRTSGTRGASGPRSMPPGAALTFASVSPCGQAEAVAVGAAAQRQIEQPLGAPPSAAAASSTAAARCPPKLRGFVGEQLVVELLRSRPPRPALRRSPPAAAGSPTPAAGPAGANTGAL